MRVAEASFWCCSIKYPGDNYYLFTQWDDLHQKQNIQKLIHIFSLNQLHCISIWVIEAGPKGPS